jgi:periplasmic protein TonB
MTNNTFLIGSHPWVVRMGLVAMVLGLHAAAVFALQAPVAVRASRSLSAEGLHGSTAPIEMSVHVDLPGKLDQAVLEMPKPMVDPISAALPDSAPNSAMDSATDSTLDTVTQAQAELRPADLEPIPAPEPEPAPAPEPELQHQLLEDAQANPQANPQASPQANPQASPQTTSSQRLTRTASASVVASHSQAPGKPAPALTNTTDLSGVPTALSVRELQYTSHPPQPAYPGKAKRLGQQGVVVLRLTISLSGAIDEMSILQSSGHALLDQAAIQAMNRVTFKPYLVNGMARRATADIPFHFVLRK